MLNRLIYLTRPQILNKQLFPEQHKCQNDGSFAAT